MAKEKWTEEDIPDQSGRVCVVTGANSGLGLETAHALAAHGASVVLAVRNLDKGAEAIGRIRGRAPHADLHLQRLDLSSLDSIRTAARELRDNTDRIDLLINNAGVMYTTRQKTTDVTEAGAPTAALAAHPGVSHTEIGRHIPGERRLRRLVRRTTQPAETGALATLRAATDPSAEGGQYYGPGGAMEMRGHPVVVTSNRRSRNPDTQRRLWAASQQLTDVSYPLPGAPNTHP